MDLSNKNGATMVITNHHQKLGLNQGENMI
jgi:hypothetical protein